MRYIITFLLLFLNWVIWSGMLDAFHLSLGVISCILVTYMTHDILFKREKFSSKHIVEVIRFIKYIPWLLYQIFLSNIHVASLVLNPKMPIKPELIRFKTKLKKDISLTTFANSITLTPGTITADIIEGEFYVHALSKKVADDLLAGEMENRVAHIFMED
ncbi:MAG: Na+/H+ antiporter subunit E [Thermodesulfovibrionales bacterium]|nr:Na+/H+ antiporter subunit E [Thermodesulfovibrionales bacterium]